MDDKEKIEQKKIYIPKPVTLEEILDVMDMKIDISDSGIIKIFDKHTKKRKEIMIKIVHEIDSKEFESWKEYDDKENLIHYKNSERVEKWMKYDDKGNTSAFILSIKELTKNLSVEDKAKIFDNLIKDIENSMNNKQANENTQSNTKTNTGKRR